MCLAALLAVPLFLPRISKQIRTNFAESLSPSLRGLAIALAEEQERSPGPSRLLARLTNRSTAPLRVLPRAQLALSPAQLARLDQDEIVVADGHGPRLVLFAALPGGDWILQYGPINPNHPMGQGRGLGLFVGGLSGLALGVYLLLLPLRRRLRDLSQAVAALQHGDLGARAAVDSPDAIGMLAVAFNSMASEIQRLLAAQKELLQVVSHELRTPLQRIHFAVEGIGSATTDAGRQKGIARIERDLKELDSLIDELIRYIRLQHEAPAAGQVTPWSSLHALMHDVVETQSELASSVALSLHPAEPPLPAEIAVRINDRLLRRALGNLIENALRSAGSRVEVRLSYDPSALSLHLDVDDDGPGVPEADRQTIFEPFSRLASPAAPDGPARPAGRGGCGLGLAIVRLIVKQHHGVIVAATSPLGGARFRLSLPAVYCE